MLQVATNIKNNKDRFEPEVFHAERGEQGRHRQTPSSCMSVISIILDVRDWSSSLSRGIRGVIHIEGCPKLICEEFFHV